MKALYIFINPEANPEKHKAEIETPGGKMFFVGVSNVKEGALLAERHVKEEGVGIIELCGGFGYEGAKTVSETIGKAAPVGMVMHHVWNASKLAELLEGLSES